MQSSDNLKLFASQVDNPGKLETIYTTKQISETLHYRAVQPHVFGNTHRTQCGSGWTLPPDHLGGAGLVTTAAKQRAQGHCWSLRLKWGMAGLLGKNVWA